MNNNFQNHNQTLPPQQNSMTNNNISNHNNNYISNNNNNGNINPKKRSLDQLYLFQNSPYFKMRSFVNQLRPLIVEACLAPNFDTCEARRGIQEKLELLVDQCRQQTVSLINCNGRTAGKDLASEKQAEQKPSLIPRADLPTQEKRFPAGNGIVKQTHENPRMPGSYIVGGSAFGWNFLMFNGTKPEYYGRTKEAFRAGL